MTRVFMFPGQSSRYPEMLDRVVAAYPDAKAVVDHASSVLGRDLMTLYRQGDQSFDRNRDVQVGVFLTSHLHLLALEASGVRAELSLGLSLGEYNHLVHVGLLSFEDALRLVDARGRAYDSGPTGMMAAIFPVEQTELEELVSRAKLEGTIEIANYNSPSQFVVAGEKPAVEALMRSAEDELAVEPAVIEKNIPMHSSVFEPVAEVLRSHLRVAPWQSPVRPYLSNVVGDFVADATPSQVVELLARHVYSPVLWRQSVDAVVARAPDAVFVEVGPRGVLYNLLQKRWHGNQKHKSDVPGDLAANFRSIGAALC